MVPNPVFAAGKKGSCFSVEGGERPRPRAPKEKRGKRGLARGFEFGFRRASHARGNEREKVDLLLSYKSGASSPFFHERGKRRGEEKSRPTTKVLSRSPSQHCCNHEKKRRFQLDISGSEEEAFVENPPPAKEKKKKGENARRWQLLKPLRYREKGTWAICCAKKKRKGRGQENRRKTRSTASTRSPPATGFVA